MSRQHLLTANSDDAQACAVGRPSLGLPRSGAGSPDPVVTEQRHETALKRPHLLVFAYACEPDRGSEPGAGWGLVRALTAFADCTVLVGTEHVPAIRRWQAEHPASSLEFVEVRERWMTPPARRHRLTRFVIYIWWLGRAHRVGAGLHRRAPFEAIWHATYSTYWLPTPAGRFDVPCAWGPVGGAVVTPWRLWSVLGWRGILSEMLDYLAVWALSAWPGTRRTWRSVSVALLQNEATLARLPPSVRSRAVVLNHALFTEVPPTPEVRRERFCLFVGALESRKGTTLALHGLTFADPQVELHVVGDGPERRSLERLALRLGVRTRVHFHGSVPRRDVLGLIRQAGAVVFTGLREEGGLALAEAMLLGAPVIVLAHGGAGHIAASATDPGRVILVVPTTPADTAHAIGDAMTRFYRDPPERCDPNLNAAEPNRILRVAVEELCGVSTSGRL